MVRSEGYMKPFVLYIKSFRLSKTWHVFFPLVFVYFPTVWGLKVRRGHSQVSIEANEFLSPSLPSWQSKHEQASSSVLGHLLPALIWTMKTEHEDTRVMTTHLCQSGIKHWRAQILTSTILLQHWTCCDISSLCEALQPTVHSEGLVCNGCPFFFFFGIFLFVFLSGKGPGIREQEAISFTCNQESLLVPYGQDQIGHICLAK